MTLAAVDHVGAPSRPSGLSRIVALDPGELGLRDLEHLARALTSLLAGARDICTYAVAEPRPHECAVIALDVVDSDTDAASLAEWVRRSAADFGVDDAGVVVWSADTAATAFAGDPLGAVGALAALIARRDRTGGRAIHFTGQDQLMGTRTIREVLTLSDIEAVDSLGIPVDLETPVVTRNFVRPTFRAGQLVLALRPRAEGMGCFEQPDPTPCCAMH
jgi:hypothetical protein